jgi:hypothetical protein
MNCRSVALIALLAAASVEAQAQSPQGTDAPRPTRFIPVSGTLTAGGGAAVGGPVTVTFSLHQSQEGGIPIWSETQQLQADPTGRYATYLGATSPLPQAAFDQEKARWLGVEVNGHAQPRVMLVAVPYALRAVDADTLGGKPVSSFLLTDASRHAVRADGSAVDGAAVDGTGIPNQLVKWVGGSTVSSSIITESPANRIGIGTTDPDEGGLLQSKVTIRSPDTLTALAVANQAGTPRWALNTYADGSVISFDRATGSYLPGWMQRGGRVGISAVDPTGGGVVDSKLTVRNVDNNTGFAILNESNARRFALNTLGGGGWQMYDGANNTWNVGLRQIGGLVSIGTGISNAKLTVVGADTAIQAESTTGFGVAGSSVSGVGATGQSNSGVGVFAVSQSSYALYVSGSGPVQAAFVGTGSVGIGTQTPSDKLQVTGDIRVGTGTTGCVRDADATVIAGTCSSDRRFKNHITPFAASLDQVARLQPVHFYWRSAEFPDKHFGASESYGLIAQDVEDVLPELVTADEHGDKAVRYSALPFHMLQAIKELKAKNDGLEAENAALRSMLADIDARLRRVEDKK